MELRFVRLREVDPMAIIELMRDPAVIRHMPLASGRFDAAECASFVGAKEALWAEYGTAPAARHGGDPFGPLSPSAPRRTGQRRTSI